MRRAPPKVENAPGIVWRPHAQGWEARWQCRTDMINKGFTPKSQRIWTGLEPSETEQAQISDSCTRLQDEMKFFGRGGTPTLNVFDGTLRSLINAYQTDPDSSYHKKRYQVRKNQDNMLRRVSERHGHEELSDIKARILLVWHKDWSNDGQKIAMGHALIAQFRVLFGFGMTILESDECARLSAILGKMRFQMGKPRNERITADQVNAVRMAAHEIGWHSIALAQALQFELLLRQKDVIGEWVPLREPGTSDVHYLGNKWITGIRWSQIDANMILTHITSKRQKEIVLDLKLAQMVVEEIAFLGDRGFVGPVILNETTGQPFSAAEFRRKWRIVADRAGIPKAVRNMDSRAGGISEATDAGADMEHIRHAATHSDIAMTQRYSRGSEEKIANVMRIRAEGRNKPKTE